LVFLRRDGLLRLDGTRAADTLAVLDQVSFLFSGSDYQSFPTLMHSWNRQIGF
jgi:hypothetical protein